MNIIYAVAKIVELELQVTFSSLRNGIAFWAPTRCTVIAEGVEEFNQKRTLESMYIDAVQGYLIAKPAPIEEINNTQSAVSSAAAPVPAPEKPQRKRSAEEILADLPRGNL